MPKSDEQDNQSGKIDLNISEKVGGRSVAPRLRTVRSYIRSLLEAERAEISTGVARAVRVTDADQAVDALHGICGNKSAVEDSYRDVGGFRLKGKIVPVSSYKDIVRNALNEMFFDGIPVAEQTDYAIDDNLLKGLADFISTGSEASFPGEAMFHLCEEVSLRPSSVSSRTMPAKDRANQGAAFSALHDLLAITSGGTLIGFSRGNTPAEIEAKTAFEHDGETCVLITQDSHRVLEKGLSAIHKGYKDFKTSQFGYVEKKGRTTFSYNAGCSDEAIRSNIESLLDSVQQYLDDFGAGSLLYGGVRVVDRIYDDTFTLNRGGKGSIERQQRVSQAVGLYAPSEDKLIVQKYAGNQLVTTAIHELGHRWWFKFMSASQREDYATFIRREDMIDTSVPGTAEGSNWSGRTSNNTPIQVFCSEYSKISTEENFAEFFALQVLGPNMTGYSYYNPNMTRQVFQKLCGIDPDSKTLPNHKAPINGAQLAESGMQICNLHVILHGLCRFFLPSMEGMLKEAADSKNSTLESILKSNQFQDLKHAASVIAKAVETYRRMSKGQDAESDLNLIAISDNVLIALSTMSTLSRSKQPLFKIPTSEVDSALAWLKKVFTYEERRFDGSAVERKDYALLAGEYLSAVASSPLSADEERNARAWLVVSSPESDREQTAIITKRIEKMSVTGPAMLPIDGKFSIVRQEGEDNEFSRLAESVNANVLGPILLSLQGVGVNPGKNISAEDIIMIGLDKFRESFKRKIGATKISAIQEESTSAEEAKATGARKVIVLPPKDLFTSRGAEGFFFVKAKMGSNAIVFRVATKPPSEQGYAFAWIDPIAVELVPGEKYAVRSGGEANDTSLFSEGIRMNFRVTIPQVTMSYTKELTFGDRGGYDFSAIDMMSDFDKRNYLTRALAEISDDDLAKRGVKRGDVTIVANVVGGSPALIVAKDDKKGDDSDLASILKSLKKATDPGFDDDSEDDVDDQEKPSEKTSEDKSEEDEAEDADKPSGKKGKGDEAKAKGGDDDGEAVTVREPAPRNVSLLLVDEGRILLVKRDGGENDGLWDLPSGQVQPGEDLYAAARRVGIESLSSVPEHVIVKEMVIETPTNNRTVIVCQCSQGVRDRWTPEGEVQWANMAGITKHKSRLHPALAMLVEDGKAVEYLTSLGESPTDLSDPLSGKPKAKPDMSEGAEESEDGKKPAKPAKPAKASKKAKPVDEDDDSEDSEDSEDEESEDSEDEE